MDSGDHTGPLGDTRIDLCLLCLLGCRPTGILLHNSILDLKNTLPFCLSTFVVPSHLVPRTLHASVTKMSHISTCVYLSASIDTEANVTGTCGSPWTRQGTMWAATASGSLSGPLMSLVNLCLEQAALHLSGYPTCHMCLDVSASSM